MAGFTKEARMKQCALARSFSSLSGLKTTEIVRIGPKLIARKILLMEVFSKTSYGSFISW